MAARKGKSMSDAFYEALNQLASEFLKTFISSICAATVIWLCWPYVARYFDFKPMEWKLAFAIVLIVNSLTIEYSTKKRGQE